MRACPGQALTPPRRRRPLFPWPELAVPSVCSALLSFLSWELRRRKPRRSAGLRHDEARAAHGWWRRSTRLRTGRVATRTGCGAGSCGTAAQPSVVCPQTTWPFNHGQRRLIGLYPKSGRRHNVLRHRWLRRPPDPGPSQARVSSCVAYPPPHARALSTPPGARPSTAEPRPPRALLCC